VKKRIGLLHFLTPELNELVVQTDKKILAEWAIDCAKRVLPYFEKEYPHDDRPRVALETLQKWIDTGEFSMKVIRKTSLDAHAAARQVPEGEPARSAARACGQAVATAHVARHSLGAAIYASKAIYEDTRSQEEAEVEGKWHYQHLEELNGMRE
jgi:hypothetical protein